MALPILLGMGIWGAGMKKRMDDSEEAKSDREFERQERKRKRAEDEAVRKAAASVNPVVNEPGDGVGPSAILVGDESYGTNNMEGAQKSAQKQRIAQQIGVLSSQGRTKEAFDLEKQQEEMVRLRKAITAQAQGEGLNEFVDDNFAMAPSVEDVKSGKVSMFDLQNVDQFNKTGKHKIPEGSRGRWRVQELENGREEVDFEVIGPDGKPVAPYSARVLQFLANHSPEKRGDVKDKRFEQGVRLDLAQQGVDIQRGYKDGMLAVARDRAQTYENGYGKTGKGVAGRDRMSEVDKEEFDMHKADAQKIKEAIMRAKADGTWEPQNNESQRGLMLQGELASRKAQDILDRYRSAETGAGQPKADPYGIRDTIESTSPPAFDVRGDPAAFRKKLEGKVDASVLAAFDAKYPQVSKKPAQAKAAGSAAPSGQSPSILQRLGSMLPSLPDGEASASAAMEQEALQLLRSGAKAPMEAMLRQNGPKLSPETRAKLQAAIKAKA